MGIINIFKTRPVYNFRPCRLPEEAVKIIDDCIVRGITLEPPTKQLLLGQ